jgi:uncharacterized protein (TIGR02145 family)
MKRFIIALCIVALWASQSGLAQSDPTKNYDICKHWELIEQIRAYEDSLAHGASLPDTLRGEYGLPVTDAGVISKVYRIYTCAALLDTLAGLQADLTFQRATAPVVDTDSVSAITATGATFHAKVTSDGGLPVLHQWFRFGTTSTNLTDSVDASALTTTPFTRAVNTLGSGTYYVAAFAKNDKGTASGDTLTFNMFTCGTSTVSYDGHNYTTVSIGTQCWFKENLRTTTYRDTSVITANLSNTAWKDYTSGAQTIYGSDGYPNHGSADTTANRNTYGRLYNWYAVSDSRGLCPTGWHVPSATEWTTLMSNYPTNPATALKDSLPPWDGLNTSGFTARPGGWRWGGDGTYSYSTIRGYFWLSTEISPTQGAVRSMMNGSASVTDEQYDKDTGFSVRCLKD